MWYIPRTGQQHAKDKTSSQGRAIGSKAFTQGEAEQHAVCQLDLEQNYHQVQD